MENNEYKNIYNTIKDKYEPILKKMRRKIWFRRCIIGMLLITLITACIYFISLNELGNVKIKDNIITFIGIASVFILIIYIVGNNKSYDKRSNIYNNYIISDIMELLGLNGLEIIKATEYENIKKKYIKPCFDARSIGSINIRDAKTFWITEKLKSTFAIVEANRYSKQLKEQIFSGLFIDIEGIEKNETTLKIFASENKYSYAFGIPKETRIEMDSQAFEKMFNVYSPNKIIAMQILTSEIMEMLIKFRNDINMPYELIIQDGHLYIRINTRLNKKLSKYKLKLDKKWLETQYNILKGIINISENIDNTIKNINI